jgi:hypothetical protein
MRRLHSHRRGDVRMRVIRFQREIFETEGENILHRRVEPHARQRARLARQLQPGLFEVVAVQMAVAAGPHELARLQFRILAPPSA